MLRASLPKTLPTGITKLILLLGSISCLQAQEMALLNLSQPTESNRILSFPAEQRLGKLFLEPESGPGWDPEQVGLAVSGTYFSAAQGDVHVPEDRNIQLIVQLAVRPHEAAAMRVQNPLLHQVSIADRTCKDPEDLSGLLKLDPNDLFRLSVYAVAPRRMGTAPEIFEPIRHLTGLQVLTISNTGVTDKDLAFLTSLRSLRSLSLEFESRISRRGLAVLKDLPTLEYLDLPEITDTGLKEVGQISSLKWLRIRTGRIWGPGLAELTKFPRLERLCIWGNKPIYDRHIKYLESLTQLKSLTLWGTPIETLTDASLASIGKLTNLEELHFIGWAKPRFTSAGAAHLRNLKRLKQINLLGSWQGPKGIEDGDEIISHLASLPHLESLKGIAHLSAEGMKTLATLKNLKCLHVDLKDPLQGYDGPTGIPCLLDLKLLEELNLVSRVDAFSDADVAALVSLSNLKELSIEPRTLSEKHLASIGKLQQLQRLTLWCSVTFTGLNQLNGLSNLHSLQVNSVTNATKTNVYTTDELMLDLSGLKKMKDLNLSGLPLQDSDFTFLEQMPSLNNLMIQPDSDSHLTGEFLRHLRNLSELDRLYVSGLDHCSAERLAHLNTLPKLRSLTLKGNIRDNNLVALHGPLSLESIRIVTDHPIRKETVTGLTESHPVIEYIHIENQPRFPTRPTVEAQQLPAPKKRPSR